MRKKYIISILFIFVLGILSCYFFWQKNKEIVVLNQIEKIDENVDCKKEDNCCYLDNDCKYIEFTGGCFTPEVVKKRIDEMGGAGNIVSAEVFSEEKYKDLSCICKNRKCEIKKTDKEKKIENLEKEQNEMVVNSWKTSRYCKNDLDCEQKIVPSANCCTQGLLSCANKNVDFVDENMRVKEICKEIDSLKSSAEPLITCDPVDYIGCRCINNECIGY